MAVARVTELISSSKKGYADAVENGIKRASKTLKNVTAAWVASHEVQVDNGRISEHRVRLKVTFILE
jgi:flavin-binding protein dodecin